MRMRTLAMGVVLALACCAGTAGATVDIPAKRDRSTERYIVHLSYPAVAVFDAAQAERFPALKSLQTTRVAEGERLHIDSASVKAYREDLQALDPGNITHRTAQVAEAVLAPAGPVVWIPGEALMDAVTAVSGSGPAYFFLLMEAMQTAAERQGLPADVAATLVRQTALGAARMACEGTETPSRLRERVTSPGGTTQAALEAFEAGGFRALVDAAIDRATVRGRELSDLLGD